MRTYRHNNEQNVQGGQQSQVDAILATLVANIEPDQNSLLNANPVLAEVGPNADLQPQSRYQNASNSGACGYQQPSMHRYNVQNHVQSHMQHNSPNNERVVSYVQTQSGTQGLQIQGHQANIQHNDGNIIYGSSTVFTPIHQMPETTQHQQGRHVQLSELAPIQQVAHHSTSPVGFVPSASVSPECMTQALGFDTSLFASDVLGVEIKKEEEPTGLQIPDNEISPLAGHEDYQHIPRIPTSLLRNNPSIQSWNGQYGFSAQIGVSDSERTKWTFSKSLNKLFVTPMTTFPIEVSARSWLSNASIVICPIYQFTEHRNLPVHRCYNCMYKEDVDSEMKKHIIRVDGTSSTYVDSNNRYMVVTPFTTPPPGENVLTIYTKVMCCTSCVGGPNRRPFSLVVMLVSAQGDELGRQVIDIKSCKSPTRDMNTEKKVAVSRLSFAINNRGAYAGGTDSRFDANTASQVRMISSTLSVERPVADVVKQDKVPTKSKRVKRDADTMTGQAGGRKKTELIEVPVKYVQKVKTYINMLYTYDQSKLEGNSGGLFSDPELSE